MDDFPLTVLLTEDDGITEGYLRAIWHPERRAAVDHPADAALAVGVRIAWDERDVTGLHFSDLGPRHLSQRGVILPPFVWIGPDVKDTCKVVLLNLALCCRG